MMILLIAGMAFQIPAARADPTSGYGRATPAQAGKKERLVKDLPYADGHAFATLDDYLAYLRDYAAPMDRPWYREMRPGAYRRETGTLTGTAREEFTRDELKQRFGFAN